jgi:hypothetical protein
MRRVWAQGKLGKGYGVWKMMLKKMRARPGLAAGILGSVASGIYVLMITLTLARLEAISGQVPFDMRPLGYSPFEATRILEGLGQEGRMYYLTCQIPLDTLYPGLLMLTLSATLYWLHLQTPHPKMLMFGIVFSVVGAVTDYAENLGVAVMLLSWPNVSDALVQATSAASILKAFSTTCAVLSVLCLAGIWVVRAYKVAGARS